MLRIYSSAFDNLLLLLTYCSWDHVLVKLACNFKWLKKNPSLNYFMEQVETWYSIGGKEDTESLWIFHAWIVFK